MSKKAKPGRPKLPRGESRGELVAVRFKPEERRRIETAARSASESVSEWMRRVLLAAAD